MFVFKYFHETELEREQLMLGISSKLQRERLKELERVQGLWVYS